MQATTVWSDPLLPNIFSWFIIIIYLCIIFLFAKIYQKNRIETMPEYKYFIMGLFFKVFMGIAFCLFYLLYYGGGDTTDYFQSSEILCDLVLKKGDFGRYFSILSGNLSHYNHTNFDLTTGYPDYWHDKFAFGVVRFTSIFTFLGLKDYITTTILIDFISFIGVWKLYEVFIDIYPKYSRNLALAVMFVPSVAFWGSGILKDNYTLGAACWLTYNFYMIFIKKKKIRINVILSILNLYLLVTLKPYIIIALFPGIIIWATLSRIKRIQNKALRVFISPALIILGLLIGFLSFSLFGENLGKYSSLESIGKTAVVTQQDLTRGEAYGQNYYDIGKFDPTLSGMLKKAPISIGTALFRPFVWEARNPAMLLSGIENTFILIIFIYIVIKVGPFKTFKIVQQEPLLLFSLLFAVIFAFSVGLTSANFGALVRYRIPCMIFLIPFLVILNEREEN